MKTTKKLVAMLVVCMLLVSVTTCAAFADELTMLDVWTMLGDTVYERSGSTLKATGEAGSESFTFEDASMQSYVLPVEALSISYDEDCDIYSAETDEYSVELVITNGALDAIGFWGISDYEDYDYEDCTYDYDGYYVDSTRERDGSHYYPWFVGASDDDQVYAEYSEGGLSVYGDGSMVDYDDPADRPWNDVAADVCHLSVETGVTAIGKNAFKGLGTSDSTFFLDLGDRSESTLAKIGDSAFEGIGLDEGSEIWLPASLEKIGSRAFANTALSLIRSLGDVITIGDDAFSGVTAVFQTVYGSSWTEDDMRDYGGDLSYETIYRFELEGECDDGGYITMEAYAPAGLFEVSLTDYSYELISFEVVKGTLPEDIDVTNPELSFNICDNVKIKAYYKAVDMPEDGDDDDDVDEEDGGNTNIALSFVTHLFNVLSGKEGAAEAFRAFLTDLYASVLKVYALANSFGIC